MRNSFERLTRSSLIVTSFALTTPLFAQASVPSSYGRVPMSFEANQGQSDAQVKFLARGPGYTLFLTAGEAVMTLREPAGDKSQPRTSVVRMRLVAANRDAQLAGLEPQPGKSNYFIGSDPARWRRDVVNYARVRYAGVYPGIDLIYHGNQRQLEYDFVLAPGADPRRIELAFDGIDRLSLDADGNLVLTTGHGKIVQHRPVVYQDIAGERKQIEGRYVLRGKRRARFQLAGYDKTHSLVIDPVLVYSTYVGGSYEDRGNAIAVDSNRNVYIAGVSNSTDFPSCTTPGCPASIQAGGPGNDVIVAKFDAAGTALLYSTYLVGNLSDVANAIAVDAGGNAYITGTTFSNDFPMVNAVQGPNVAGSQSDAFVTKINAAGNSIIYSTYLGGGGIFGFGDDVGNGIAVDSNGNSYITGRTSSSACSSGPSCDAGHGLVGCFIDSQCQTTGFPLTANAFQSNNGGDYDAFVSKLNPAGSTLLYSTFLGGTGHDAGNGIAVTPEGNAWVTGITQSSSFPGASTSAIQPAMSGIGDAFVVKFNVAGNALTFSTYLGGNSFDQSNAIALDGTGNAYITGSTGSSNFPGAVTSTIQSTNHGGHEDAFVAKVKFDGTALLYSTYLGGSGRGDSATPDDIGRGIAVDSSNAAYVMGDTYSLDFPTADPIQNDNAGVYDMWVAKVNPAASALIFSTYLGGNGVEYAQGIAVDSSGNAYVVGATASPDYPTVDPFQDMSATGFTDAFVTKISPLKPTVTSLLSSANPSVSGDTVTFSATVTGTGVTGSVQFKDGAADLGAPVTLTGGSASYPTSTLTAGIHSITAVYGGDSTFYTSTSSPLSQTIQPPFGAPSGLIAMASQFTPMALVTWNLVGHANHYEVLRRSTISGAYVVIATPAGTTYADSAVVANTTYLYNVRAVDGSGTLSAESNTDAATMVIFADEPLGGGSSIVKAVHLNQLRTAVDAMRFSAELIPASYPYTDPSIGSTTRIKAVHISELRTALNAARAAIGMPNSTYVDNTLTANTTRVKAAHFQELRDRTK